jgi:hypothetical protein
LNKDFYENLNWKENRNVGMLRFDLSDQQVDVSPKHNFDFVTNMDLPFEEVYPPQLWLEAAKKVRLPNISLILSFADGSPDWDAETMAESQRTTNSISEYRAARVGILRTEGRPGVDLLSIPRGLSDWGGKMRSTLDAEPNASYSPKSFAVFRGHATGFGWRKAISELAQRRPDLIDAGSGDDDWLTDEQQMRFQAIIAPDGNSIPDRLSRQLAYGVPVVFVHPLESLNEFWYSELVPWVHYVPSSGQDLEMTLDSLRENPALAQQIGLNGKRFVEERLTEHRVRCYLYTFLQEYAARFEY